MPFWARNYYLFSRIQKLLNLFLAWLLPLTDCTVLSASCNSIKTRDGKWLILQIPIPSLNLVTLQHLDLVLDQDLWSRQRDQVPILLPGGRTKENHKACTWALSQIQHPLSLSRLLQATCSCRRGGGWPAEVPSTPLGEHLAWELLPAKSNRTFMALVLADWGQGDGGVMRMQALSGFSSATPALS